MDHIMPMAESSWILPFSCAYSIPRAEAMAKIMAPIIGLVPQYMAIPKPPKDAWVIPPHRKTIRRETTYVPTIPQVMPAKMAAKVAFIRY